MNGFAAKTVSEQKLDWFETLHRPLTDAESDELRRCLHAVYCRNLKRRKEQEILSRHRAEEHALADRIERENGWHE